MEKVDFKKTLKHLYLPSQKAFTIVAVPSMQFLMVDGHGNPNTSQDYRDAIEALYGLAYTLKFASKQQLEKDYTVPPLEGLWWTQDMDTFSVQNKDDWDWTMMIMTPDWIAADMVAAAREELQRKKNPVALPKVRLETYHEGLSVQILYLGAYADEGPTIARMHSYAHENGYALRGKHHELYISDPGRVAPEKCKTVIRQPIANRS
ncbi:MAG: GyrI-like domain-containing protein [Anaerolineae bacterium]|nr:GyrI-like domain-containing protein [Anaerolineae bacterium]